MTLPGLDKFAIVALTHKSLPLDMVGLFHLDAEDRAARLAALKEALDLSELMYLATCNRIEFSMVAKNEGEVPDMGQLCDALGIRLGEKEMATCVAGSEFFVGLDAVEHMLKVASSLESMVVGEREIITQVRTAYEDGQRQGLTGEILRLANRLTIETAKEIFTETDIFKKPVSVVSLAFKRLKELNFHTDSRVVMVGAGRTNRAMARFLVKHGYQNLTIYNRTLARAEELAKDVGGRGRDLSDIDAHDTGFDVLISCTASGGEVITPELYAKLNGGESGTKVIVDLALPGDVAKAVVEEQGANVHHIDIEELRHVAEKNLRERAKEVTRCEEIIRESLGEFELRYRRRKIEMAMSEVPEKIKEIRQTALATVYAKEIEGLNAESREVLDKVMSYMEKKYISLPMANVWHHADDIDRDLASIFDPFGNAVHTALTFEILGEDVLITGAGPIGCMAAAICRYAGARYVVVTDVNPWRLELAKKMGATRVVDVRNERIAEVQKELGMTEGFDVGLEMSGHADAFREMIDNMCHGGKIAMLGIPSESIAIDWNKVVFNMLTIKGIYGREMFETWYKMAAMLEGGLDVAAGQSGHGMPPSTVPPGPVPGLRQWPSRHRGRGQ